MRVVTFSFFALAATLGVLASACGGDDAAPSPTAAAPAGTGTPAPTATPLASVPEPVVVSGSGLPSGRGSSEAAAEYTVESGDTLLAIASRFGVEVDTIREANNLPNDDLQVGQVLTIPRRSTASTGPDATSTPGTGGASGGPAAGSGSTYTVVEGDTAFGIALQFDVTVEALAAANDMTEEEITDLSIGQVLQIPSPE